MLARRSEAAKKRAVERPVIALVELTAADAMSQQQTAMTLNRQYAFHQADDPVADSATVYYADVKESASATTGHKGTPDSSIVGQAPAAPTLPQRSLDRPPQQMSNRTVLMKRVLPDGAFWPTLQEVQSQWPQARVQRISPAAYSLSNALVINTATQQALGAVKTDATSESGVEKLQSSGGERWVAVLPAEEPLQELDAARAPAPGAPSPHREALGGGVGGRAGSAYEGGKLTPSSQPQAGLAPAGAARAFAKNEKLGEPAGEPGAATTSPSDRDHDARMKDLSVLAGLPATTAPSATQPDSGQGVILVYVRVAEPGEPAASAPAAAVEAQPAAASAPGSQP
jgi:hypothetical protein